MRKETIGDCELYLGDCLEIMPTLGKVDAVVTDPPYQISGKFSDENRRNGSTRVLNFHWDKGLTIESILSALQMSIDLLNRPGNLVVWCSDAQIQSLRELLIENGFSVKPLAWVKENPPPTFKSVRFSSGFELAVMAYEANSFWGKEVAGNYPNVWIADGMRSGNPERSGHPTQKPLGLMEWQVSHLVRKNTICLDMFMGSGTTGVACVKLGRKFIGIELEPKYFDIACRRIEEAYKQPDLFIEPPKKAEQTKLFEAT